MSSASFIDSPAQLLPAQQDGENASPFLAGQAEAAVARNEAIDVMRFFAAAGIVFVHAGESLAFDRWGNLFRFGVPFFLFASLYYQSASLRRHPDRTVMQLISGRLARLYVPFLVWSIIYLLVRDVKRVCILHIGLVSVHLAMLWTGTEYHLWFLPFLLTCSIALAVMQRALFRHDPRLQWPAIGIAIGIGLAIANGPSPTMPSVTESSFDGPNYAYIQWWLALPAASWSFAFAWLTTLLPIVDDFTPIVGIAGLVLTACCSLKQALHGMELGPRGCSGLGCMITALTPWRGRSISVLARFGRLGYGIYLCHVLPVEVIHVITHRFHLVPSSLLDVITFAISFLASIAIVAILARMPRLAWLIG